MNKKYTIPAVLVLILVVLISLPAFAQFEVCAGGYPRSDRVQMKKSHYDLEASLQNLAFFAQDVAQYPLTDENYKAYKEMWQYSVDALNNYTNYNNTPLSGGGIAFVRAVANSAYLNIPDLFPDGVRGTALQANARETLDKVNFASITLKTCMYGSWSKIAMSDVGGGSCRSLYRVNETNIVIAQLVKGLRYLHNMRDIAERATIPAFSTTDRRIMNTDLLFQIEELYILKDQKVTATGMTLMFFKALFHPKTLGIQKVSVAGQWENESLALAKQALQTIDRAIEIMTSCVQYGNGLPVKR